MSWFKKSGSTPPPSNDTGTEKAREIARKNFEQGKTPSQTRRDIENDQRRGGIKPVKE